MARLRRVDTDNNGAAPATHDMSTDATNNIATSTFSSTIALSQPFSEQDGKRSCDSVLLKPSLNTTQKLIPKKESPRKDARKQIHLRPMNFAKQDQDLSVLAIPKEQDDSRQRLRRNSRSPVKLPASRLPSNTSFESMITDTDDGSDFSLPTSLPLEIEFSARIPESLVSPTKRQLFSPAKRKPVTIAEVDDIAYALATTKISDASTWDPELEGSIVGLTPDETFVRPQFELHMPTLLPPTQNNESLQRPSTPPPLSPTKSKLVSPSKIKCRIPTPPSVSTSNGFWSVEKVNDWNDQHSPHKVVRSPKKSRFLQFDEPPSPTGSPRKQPSPSKMSPSKLAVKKDFDGRKKEIATAFLAELDETITQGQIGRLSASTGGVQLIWSKTLNSTAGRANWRRERTIGGRTEANAADSKHFASIDLAEKVIDNETKLLNVLAHEFCHLANFMVSGVKDRPHGAEFKAWGKKCTLAFGLRGIEVTTKHTYDIDYKYIWECTNDDCHAEYKRHSKSIDPSRQTCGTCRSKLIQTRPVPRKATTTGAKPAGYAGFVKEHYAAVKQDMPGASQKDIMTRIGEKYRAAKQGVDQASHQADQAAVVDLVTEKLETIDLTDADL